MNYLLDVLEQKSCHGVKYSCSMCDYQAIRQIDLTRHEKSIHEGFKYYCSMCGYQATTQSNLKRHEKY